MWNDLIVFAYRGKLFFFFKEFSKRNEINYLNTNLLIPINLIPFPIFGNYAIHVDVFCFILFQMIKLEKVTARQQLVYMMCFSLWFLPSLVCLCSPVDTLSLVKSNRKLQSQNELTCCTTAVQTLTSANLLAHSRT